MQNMETREFETVVECSEFVEQLFTERPDRRKKKLYEEWIKEINKYAKLCNKMANYPIYGKLK